MGNRHTWDKGHTKHTGLHLAEKELSVELIWGSDLPRNINNIVNKYIDNQKHIK